MSKKTASEQNSENIFSKFWKNADKYSIIWQDFKALKLFPDPWPKVWIVIFVAILLLSQMFPTGGSTSFVKLGGIFLCFFYTRWYFPNDKLLQLSFLTTSISDIILAVNNISIPGLLTFLLTQIIHQVRLNDGKIDNFAKAHIILAVTSITINTIFNIIPIIYVVCTFYAIMLVKNITSAYWWCFEGEKFNFMALKTQKNYHAIFALIGFVLFLACDLCTVVSYFSLIGVLPWFMYGLANFFAWTFYYPSQIFVSNSSKCDIIPSKKVLTEVTDGR